eukprot:g43886.t1
MGCAGIPGGIGQDTKGQALDVLFLMKGDGRKLAASQLEEFHEMLDFVLKWLEKAKNLGYSAISWQSAAQLNDQLITYQVTLRESEEIQSDLQAMGEKLDSVSDVYQTGAMSQRVTTLRQQTDELQQLMRTCLQSLQDAAK